MKTCAVVRLVILYLAVAFPVEINGPALTAAARPRLFLLRTFEYEQGCNLIFFPDRKSRSVRRKCDL